MPITPGATDQTVYLFIQDAATGLAKTGLAYNSAGAACYYTRPLSAAVAVPLITQTAIGAHADGGFVEVSATNAPGLYRLDLPDAVVAVGASEAVVEMAFTGCFCDPLKIVLDATVGSRSSHGAADVWAATGRTLTTAPATPLDIAALQTHGDTEWATADVSGLATTLGLASVEEAILAALESVGGGSGAYAVTPTVQDQNGDPIAGAWIVLQGDGGFNSLKTSATGRPTSSFFRGADTYTVTIADRPGQYTGFRGSIVVAGEEDFAVLDAEGDPVAGNVILVTTLAQPAPAPAGYCNIICAGGTPSPDVVQGCVFRLDAYSTPHFSGGWAICPDPESDPFAGIPIDETTGLAVMPLLQGARVSLGIYKADDTNWRSALRYTAGVYVPYEDTVEWPDMTTTEPTVPTS